jgi:hypothetical protein
LTLQVPQALQETPEIPDELYRHKKRPEWGLSILIGDEGDRRAYRFEDGAIRKFKKGYYDFLKPVKDFKGFAAIHTRLVEAEESDSGESSERKSAALEPVCTFEDQVRLLKEMYPGGFAGEEWTDRHRGSTSGSSAKRHRAPTIELGKSVLDPDRCRTLLEEDGHEELMASVVELLSGTDLVPLAHVKALRSLSKEDSRAYAEAVVNLVSHEPKTFGLRFREYLFTLKRVLGAQPSWRVATALMAIARPDEHVCVRRSAFLRQAASIAPNAKYTRGPRLPSYLNFLDVATTVREKLEAAGEKPRDMLDVYDFVWATLRKSALAKLR